MNDVRNEDNDENRTTPLGRAERALDALRIIASPKDRLSDADRETLLAWGGWGALAPAFDTRQTSPSWIQIADELDALLGDDATAGSTQVDTSYFTPDHIIDRVYDILLATGFTGGKVLEPGVGTGRFIERAPRELPISWTGIEIDPTSARIAQTLHPDASIINDRLEHTVLRSASFDAVIGNVPFSSTHVYDRANPTASGNVLHQYFLLRALDAVRPGGYVITITSRYVIDGRRHISALTSEALGGELIAAIRLPSGTFSAEGTEVVSDLLVLRRRHPDDTHRRVWDDDAENATVASTEWPYQAVTFRPTITAPAVEGHPGIPTEVNSWWAKHPELVAGTMKVTTFSQNPIVVTSDDIRADIERATAAALPLLIPMVEKTEIDDLSSVPLEDGEGRKEGSFHIVDGEIVEIINGIATPVRNNQELRYLIALRDAAVALIRLESEVDLPDHAIDAARAAAAAEYARYVEKFGPLNRGTLAEGKDDPETGQPTYVWRRPSMGGFRRDPDYAQVIAMEEFDQDSGAAAPAPILRHRVNRRPVPVSRVDTPAEALAVTLGESHRVDLDRIAGLLDLADADAARDALGDLVYELDGHYVTARDYLSGNIREKLAIARRRAEHDQAWRSNVAALEAVLPADLGPLDIRVTLGVPWVTEDDVKTFTSEVLGLNPELSYTPIVSVWDVNVKAYNRESSEALIAYGTSRVRPLQLLDWALNGKPAVVYDEFRGENGNMVRVRNFEQSAAAAEKMAALNDRFSTWIWEEESRSMRIAAEYNRRFNSHVQRRADGSGLVFPGLAADVTPWAHQRDAVDRICSSERALIGHPVGAGKTKSMILSAMTLRRLGLAKKPMIVVPNHLLDQIVREAQQAFPTARFLIAGREDLQKDRRRVFAARAATGDWDAIVTTHQAFTSLPVHPEAEKDWIEKEKAELRHILAGNRYRDGKGPKAVARALKALDTRLSQLRSNENTDDGQVTFEQLGVDYLLVDEVHLFRRLSTGSTSRDNGFGSSSSKRATDLLVKIETLAERYPGKPIVAGFTGTPWSNTLAETWVWQRYFQPDALRAADILAFDPWVATFVRYENAIEVAPDGSGFRMQNRPVGMKNLPELRTMLGRIADIVTAEQIGLERPDYEVHNVVVPGAPQQIAYVKSLAERADDIRGGTRPKRPGGGEVDDSMLLVCNDGRKVALDPLLVGIDEASPKIAEAARTIARLYHDGKDRRFGTSPKPGTIQLALLDLGTPHPGDSRVYGRLRAQLSELGVPAQRIRFIHEAKTDKARAAMFAQAREGDISVLLGSTSKVGIGTNIQTRLAQLHHIDAPWTPAEVEQREGRALRPGNLSDHVDIYRYVTESTFDAFVWAALERKARSFAALYDQNSTVREVEDVSGTALSYGEVKALASGNPLLLDQAKVAAEVQRLRLMRSVHLQSVNRAKRDAANALREATSADRYVDHLTTWQEWLTEHDSEQSRTAERVQLTDFLRTAFSGDAKPYARAEYRGIRVALDSSHPTKRKSDRAFSLRHGWTLSLDHFVFAAADRRGGAPAAAEAIIDFIDKNASQIRTRAQWYTAQAEAQRDAAAASTAAAGSAVFEHDDALAQAIARLAQIDAEIEREATPQRELVAA